MGYELSFLALMITLLFIGITGLYPGGIIVPGYLVLFTDQPERIAGTLFAAFLTLGLYKIASQYLILFGKRRFVFMVLFGGVITYLWFSILPEFFPGSLEYRVIGWVIPGLIANNFERQGILLTTASLITVIVVVFFIDKWLVFLV